MEEDDSKRKTSDVTAANLTDDLVVDILSRLPAKPLHRFKCISRSWQDMISDPYNRKKLTQTLAGFFHTSSNLNHMPVTQPLTRRRRHFTNVSGIHDPPLVRPELDFLPSDAGEVVTLDCCNGLLLCRYGGWIDVNGMWILPPQTFHYVVCNPATETWVDLPVSSGHLGTYRTSRLAFDPAVSSHFHVFEYELQETDGGEHEQHLRAAVGFYSSRTGRWSHHTVCGLSQRTKGALRHVGNRNLLVHAGTVSRTVFLHGALHLLGSEKAIAVVDMETKGWRNIQLPPCGDGDLGFLGKSQGCLFYMNTDVDNKDQLSFWALDDYGGGAWNLKLTLSASQVFGTMDFRSPRYSVIAVHPDGNVIFFVSHSERLLMSYDMDRSEAGYIRDLGLDHHYQFMPYVPLFSESIADDEH